MRFLGYWLFHCHIEFHAEIGMSLIFKVGEHEEMPPVPSNFPKCGNWMMTQDYSNTSDSADKILNDTVSTMIKTEELPTSVKVAMSIDHLLKLLPQLVRELRPRPSSAYRSSVTLLPVILACLVSFVRSLYSL